MRPGHFSVSKDSTSEDSMSEDSTCDLCYNLEVGSNNDLGPWDQWISDICDSKCLFCNLIVNALRKVAPHEFSSEYFEEDVSLHISATPRLTMAFHTSDFFVSEFEVQLFKQESDSSRNGTFRDIPTGWEISPKPGDPAMWTFLQKSLQHCLEEHHECGDKQDLKWFPTRLVHLIRDCQDGYAIKLIETKDEPPVGPYIALSHCWGSKPLLRTTEATISSHRRNMIRTDLPCTFQDALTVANELGVSYIWIDSLCIIQDSKVDWARESQTMNKVYQNALFVVAAVSSKDGSVSFLGEDAPSIRDKYQACIINSNVGTTSTGLDRPHNEIMARRDDLVLHPSSIDGPLESRAWAWQERHCAIRIISFTEAEVKWTCRSGRACECDQKMHGRYENSKSIPDNMSYTGMLPTRWLALIENYSKRDLTCSTDRLPALAGIASHFNDWLQSAYVAGLWEVDLPRGLAWYRPEIPQPVRSKIPTAIDNGVPTWSWASSLSPSRWPLLESFPWADPYPDWRKLVLESTVQVTSIDCRPSTHNIYGEVEKGSYIDLRGHVIEAQMECDDYGDALVQRAGFTPRGVILDCRIVTDQDGQYMRRATSADEVHSTTDAANERPLSYQGTVYCLLLLTATFSRHPGACILILGRNPQDPGTFQRLGIGYTDGWGPKLFGEELPSWTDIEAVERFGRWEEWFADAETRTVRIM